MWKKIISLNLVLLLIVAMLPIGTISAAADNEVSTTVTFYYDVGDGKLKQATANPDENGWYFLNDSNVNNKVFVGYTTAQDGTGKKYPHSGMNLPSPLYAQYETLKDGEAYVVLGIMQDGYTFDTGYYRTHVTINNGIITLPSTVKDASGNNVGISYWTIVGDTSNTTYASGEIAAPASGIRLMATVDESSSNNANPSPAGSKIVTFYYLTWGNDGGTTETSRERSITDGSWYNQGADDVYNNIFIGWYYDDNGSITEYPICGTANSLPNELHAKYRVVSADYVILDATNFDCTLDTGYQRDCVTLTDRKVTLPATVKNVDGKVVSVAYWFSQSESTVTYYKPIEENTIDSNTILYPLLAEYMGGRSTPITTHYLYSFTD
jgi:hypothetical protein